MTDFVEIERKFLVTRLPDLSQARRAEIAQGYLTRNSDSVQIRLRAEDARRILTVKSGWGMTRSEREIALTEAQFDTLWPATEGRRLEKERWTGPLPGGLRYELDIFHGALAPLQVVEVEFDSVPAADAFRPPDWFGREVTDDPRYGNRAMVTEGIPEES
ncbi:CYTH domain-containing protein [Pseudodonghicola xiamenensis]|uniref:CYTH domain-containing protein n=1 Tax=Pseudodonghicola xiamenensis TaxID=337702 RepID=A0A8J3H580_9RHOB|nr:CYTH domain-containing protein [Pseudodonghicola xiamenensis]GHG81499.1 CYTH domain-containing protein [Pseudodonghicola xiamenensis]